MLAADVERDPEAGWVSVEHCLIKPFLMRDLLATVSTLLPRDTAAR